jgi:DNA-binding transcriptional regulator YiaG
MIQMVSNEGTMAKTLNEVETMTAKRMKRLRTLAGMSQRELANAVGVKQPSICRWESGDYTIPAWAAKLITIVTSPQPETKSA